MLDICDASDYKKKICTFPDPTAPIIAQNIPFLICTDIFFSVKKLGSAVQLADTSWIVTAVSSWYKMLVIKLAFVTPEAINNKINTFIIATYAL